MTSQISPLKCLVEDLDIFEVIDIEINDNCNMACSYCPNSVTERKTKGEMEPELFIKLMKELAELNYAGEVCYEFYNEPMLAQNFDWFIQTTKKFLPQSRTKLYTNGVFLTLSRFNQLCELGLDKFIVTKHEGLKRYVFDETFEQLSSEQKKRVVYRNYEELRLTNRGGILKVGPEGLPPLLPCQIPSFLTVVTNKGNVLPCMEDFHEENVMGNINDQTIKEIWDSNHFKKFRQKLNLGLRHAHRPCSTCNRVESLRPTNNRSQIRR